MTEGQAQVLLNDTEKLINVLERIADSLESIKTSLETLEPLSECVGYVPPAPYQKEGYYILRIGGNVDNGNY